MENQITITKALAGYTRISYNGQEIAKHHLSATTQGTREAFDIPEDVSVIDWLFKNFEDDIRVINYNGKATVNTYRHYGRDHK